MAALAVIATAGLITACGATAPDSRSGGNDAATNHAKAVKFAECMRAHGVSGFPDPNSSGTLTLDGVVNGSSLNPNAPAFKHAISVCKSLEPSGFTGHKRSAQEQQAGLEFAQCVRAHGVSDFPDPTPNSPLVDTNRIPSTATSSGMSILNAAMRQCRGAAAAAGVHR